MFSQLPLLLTLAALAFFPVAMIVSSNSKLKGTDWHTHQIAREYIGEYLSSACEYVGYEADYTGHCIMSTYVYVCTIQIIAIALALAMAAIAGWNLHHHIDR